MSDDDLKDTASAAPPRVAANRKHDRVVYNVRVTFAGMGLVFPGAVENISEGGAFVVTDDPLPIDTRLSFALAIGDKTVSVEGIVVWNRAGTMPGRAAGMGVRFENVDEATQAHIAAFVAHQAPAPQ